MARAMTIIMKIGLGRKVIFLFFDILVVTEELAAGGFVEGGVDFGVDDVEEGGVIVADGVDFEDVEVVGVGEIGVVFIAGEEAPAGVAGEIGIGLFAVGVADGLAVDGDAIRGETATGEVGEFGDFGGLFEKVWHFCSFLGLVLGRFFF